MGASTGLNFDNLSWQHVSVETLVPADPVNIPDFAIRLPHAPSFFGARVRASARVQPVVLAVEDLGEAARNLEQSIPRRLGQLVNSRSAGTSPRLRSVEFASNEPSVPGEDGVGLGAPWMALAFATRFGSRFQPHYLRSSSEPHGMGFPETAP
jgi:hypothetical protein